MVVRMASVNKYPRIPQFDPPNPFLGLDSSLRGIMR